MPTIEKLLSSDWKERLLGRNTADSKEVKGEVTHLYHSPSCTQCPDSPGWKHELEAFHFPP